jgi:hypothetical protein
MGREDASKVLVTVNNTQWTAVSSFRDAGPKAAVYTLNPENWQHRLRRWRQRG